MAPLICDVCGQLVDVFAVHKGTGAVQLVMHRAHCGEVCVASPLVPDAHKAASCRKPGCTGGKGSDPPPAAS